MIGHILKLDQQEISNPMRYNTPPPVRLSLCTFQVTLQWLQSIAADENYHRKIIRVIHCWNALGTKMPENHHTFHVLQNWLHSKSDSQVMPCSQEKEYWVFIDMLRIYSPNKVTNAQHIQNVSMLRCNWELPSLRPTETTMIWFGVVSLRKKCFALESSAHHGNRGFEWFQSDSLLSNSSVTWIVMWQSCDCAMYHSFLLCNT